jgi:oleate hydratase
MESVYTLLNIDRGIPEVWGSTYDIRDLLNATSTLSDGKKLTDISLEPNVKAVLAEALKKITGTDIEKLLKEYQLI